jgi:hypothetical protein
VIGAAHSTLEGKDIVRSAEHLNSTVYAVENKRNTQPASVIGPKVAGGIINIDTSSTGGSVNGNNGTHHGLRLHELSLT